MRGDLRAVLNRMDADASSLHRMLEITASLVGELSINEPLKAISRDDIAAMLEACHALSERQNRALSDAWGAIGKVVA